MGLPALKIEPEVFFVEERVARLEAYVEHIQTDISEMKTDIRGIRGEIREMDKNLLEFRGAIELRFEKLEVDAARREAGLFWKFSGLVVTAIFMTVGAVIGILKWFGGGT